MPKGSNGSRTSTSNRSISTLTQPSDDVDQSTNNPEADGAEISKSQRKREASAITDLAQQISELPQTDFDELPMEQSVRDAITALRKISQFGARKRQLLYAGKVLRKSDPEPLRAALTARKNLTDRKNLHFQALENWRDRLIGDQGDQALTELLNQHPDLERQRIRQLVRKARTEQTRQQAPKSSRELFRLLRETLEPPSE